MQGRRAGGRLLAPAQGRGSYLGLWMSRVCISRQLPKCSGALEWYDGVTRQRVSIPAGPEALEGRAVI